VTVLEILIRAREDASKAFEQIHKSGKAAAVGVTEEMKKLQAQLARMKQAQADFTAEHGKASPRIAEVTQRLKDQIGALNATGAGAEKAGSGIGSFAIKASVASAAVVALSKALFESVQSAVAYEKTLVQIEVLTGTNAGMVREWSDELKTMAGEVGKGPQELAEALYFAASAGQTTSAALDIVRLSAQGAMIGMGDTSEITKALTAIMNSYSASGLKAADAMDILMATVREGGAEADQLAGSIGRVAGVAAQFGIELEEVGAFVATFTRVIPSAAEAVTSLRQTILNLMAPAEETKKQLKELGMSAEGLRISIREKGLMATLADLMEKTGGNVEQLDKLIPNVRALAGVMATTGAQGEQYKDILFSIQNAHGDFDKAVERTEETVAARWDKMVAKAKSASLRIGEFLMGAAEQFEMLMGKGGGIGSTLAEPPDPAPWNDFGSVLTKSFEGAADAAGGLAEAHAVSTQEAMEAANAAERSAESKKKDEDAAKKAANEVLRYAESLRKLRDSFDGTAAQAEMDDLAKATQGLNLEMDLTPSKFKDLGERVLDLVEAGAELPPVFERAVQSLQETAIAQLLLVEGAKLIGAAAKGMADDHDDAMDRLRAKVKEAIEADKDRAEETKKNAEDIAKAHEREMKSMDGVVLGIGEIRNILSILGVESDSTLGQMIAGMDDLANAADEGAKAYAKFMSGDIAGGIVGGLRAIGGIVSGIKSLFGGGEAKKLREEIAKAAAEAQKLRQEFISSHGGLEALHRKAEQAGVTLAAMFSAKNAEELKAAILGIKDAIDFQNEAQERLNAAVDKYGLTIDELGPRFAQQKLDEMAGELFADYEILRTSGADMVAVHGKMAESFSEYVQQVIKGGGTIPEAMRPVIEQLITEGKLVDENGKAYGSAEEAGIQFAKTQSEAFADMLEQIERLVAAIERMAGIKPPPIKVPIEPDYQGNWPGGTPHGPPKGPMGGHGLPEFHSGGFTGSGLGQFPAMLQRNEFVHTVPQMQELLATAMRMAQAGNGGGTRPIVIHNQVTAEVDRKALHGFVNDGMRKRQISTHRNSRNRSRS
jgi:TP901 family phage tail tape measure protein